uniref:C-type lectin domain-containing protein n=1 Tax=Astyanax mexicanus TaxID=7994 RepID=A0A8B9GTF0_ASTMX
MSAYHQERRTTSNRINCGRCKRKLSKRDVREPRLPKSRQNSMCTHKKHQLNLDHSIIPRPTEVPRTFIKLGNSSYMLVQTNMTWKEAQSHCQSVGANLASIRDVFAQYHIELQADKLKQPIWVGLNNSKKSFN